MMNRAGALRVRTSTMLVCVTLVLVGCSGVDLSMFSKKTGNKVVTPAPATSSVKLVERDVEDPNVFQVTEPALWDGRPSLGGVWVAYPGQIQPMRVIIRNQENKKFVIGALFKRERMNPGPKIQLSSEAAAALGILAGKPTVLNVTALRRESVPETPTSTAITPTEKPPLTVAKGGAAKTSAKQHAKADVAKIAALAIKKAAGSKPPKARRSAGKIAATKPAAAAPVRPPVSTLAKPYIQIGIFSIETNATNTATSLRTEGVLPIIKAQKSRGKKFWRVLVGPAATKSERAALLKKARALGFSDAYFVTK